MVKTSPIMDQPKFEARYGRVDEPKETAAKKAMAKATEAIQPRALFGFLSSLLPILEWFPAYRWKEDFLSDLIAGVTVGIMVVPQGMAYASLANVPPVVGLYANFIAIFIYMFFGTSKHISVGTFAVASMMVGNAQLLQFDHYNSTMSPWDPQMTKFGIEVSPLELTSSLTLGVGIAQLVMGLFRLAFLTKYISDPLVSGFTTGAAMHVFMSQVPKAMGIKIPATPGIGELVFKVYNCILGIPRINWVTFTIALLGCAFLWLGRDLLNPPFQKRFKLPIPFELILVIVTILASQLIGLNEKFKVSIVKHVPNGFPPFTLPNLKVIPHILPDIISISIICFMFAFSMSKLFAKKHKYKVDANQELHALGIVHAIASCFPVYPVGASLSRSSLCELAGARTQLNAIFTSGLLFFVIMFIGHLLEPLPMAVLAAIVMVSLKGLFMQFGDIPKLWKLSKIDCITWLVACFTTMLLDVTLGLAISVAFVIMTLVLREQWPQLDWLASTEERDVFKPAGKYQGLLAAGDSQDVKVLRFGCPLHFANVEKLVDFVGDYLVQVASTPPQTVQVHNNMEEKTNIDESKPSNTLILDGGAIAYVDSMGIEALVECYRDAGKVGVRVFYADFSDLVIDSLARAGFFQIVPKDNFFPTVRDAVETARIQ